MRAIGIPRPDRMHDISMMNVPVPEIDDDEVLVRVQAVGVGLHDRWSLPTNPQFPHVIGLEGAGTIVRIGHAVTGQEPGDRVMFSIMPQPKGGTWAEFVAVPAPALIAVPDGLEFTDAAALPVAGLTALEGISALGLGQGGSVFIAGASGAIGTLAIQLATMCGYRVAASSSSRNHEYMRSLGVELAVDYRDPSWPEQVLQWLPGGVDAALAIQPGTGATSLEVIHDGGKLVTISGDQVTPERQIRVEQVVHHPETRQALARLAADVAAGRMRVVLERVYPFDEGIAALAKTASRRAQGKLVLTLEDH